MKLYRVLFQYKSWPQIAVYVSTAEEEPSLDAIVRAARVSVESKTLRGPRPQDAEEAAIHATVAGVDLVDGHLVVA